MKQKLFVILCTAAMAFSLMACGNQAAGNAAASAVAGTETGSDRSETGISEKSAEGKVLKMRLPFMYQLDPHVDSNNGWTTLPIGLTEDLFKINDQFKIEPWLAESYTQNENVLTVKLKDKICFSNGKEVTAEMVVRNLQRMAEKNADTTLLQGADFKAADNKTVVITTAEAEPTLVNALAGSWAGIVDLDDTTDFNKPVCTGPFVVKDFEKDSKIVLTKNEKYWGGMVALDGVEAYYMEDDNAAQMSMQNGEIDLCISPSPDSLSVYQKEPDTYKITTTPQARLYYYYLNNKTLDPSVRKAVIQGVNSKDICTMLNNIASPSNGAFADTSDYGKVTKAGFDTSAAKKSLEADGYTMGADGYYVKNGKTLELSLDYYPARALDKIAALMQDQMKTIGIKVNVASFDDPDATYIKSKDFDLGLYCMIANKDGDPYAYLSSVMGSKGSMNAGSYHNEKVDKLLDEMKSVTDETRKAELACQIQQQSIDDDAYGFIGVYNKILVMQNGIKNYGEKNPTDYYVVSNTTDKKQDKGN